MKKEVLILFKTHLDVGFTDLAASVKKKYLTEYIPNAIKVGYELKDTALVAPFGRRLLRYGEETGCKDLYFNLYNNICNTNFPMWYSDNSVFRFNITKLSERN